MLNCVDGDGYRLGHDIVLALLWLTLQNQRHAQEGFAWNTAVVCTERGCMLHRASGAIGRPCFGRRRKRGRQGACRSSYTPFEFSPAHAMVMINAAALPATLVESELFGYSAGAFTGASQKGHAGKFEQANKSTLFLDEIGDMPLDVQAKLLRVLHDGSVEKLGGIKPIKIDFRLVTATNRDLEDMIAQGAFRLDLSYRISPVILRVPPLRDRLEDIPALAERFLMEFAQRHARKVCKLSSQAIAELQSRPWPGNIRQLKHELERAAIFNTSGDIRPEDLVRGGTAYSKEANQLEVLDGLGETLKQQVDRLENRVILNTLDRVGGNRKRAAEELNISRSYLYKKLGDLDVQE